MPLAWLIEKGKISSSNVIKGTLCITYHLHFSCLVGYNGPYCQYTLPDKLDLLAQEAKETFKVEAQEAAQAAASEVEQRLLDTSQGGSSANVIPAYVLGACALLVGLVAIAAMVFQYKKSSVSISVILKSHINN